MSKLLKENDIRPKALEAGQKQAQEKDIDWLLARKEDFVSVTCPACGSEDKEDKFEKNGFHYDRCTLCDTFYVNPRPSATIIEEFLKISENYAYWDTYIFPASKQARKERIFKPRVDDVLEICKKHTVSFDRLLEVGVGHGFFLEEMKSRNAFKELVGVEPSKEWANHCRSLGVEVIEQMIEDIEPDPENLFDVVVNFEVIEHLFSPKDFIQGCSNLLKSNGVFIVTCPNGKGFDIELLGTKSSTVDHEHLNYFNPESLSLLLEKNGFEVLEATTPGKMDADLVRNKVLEGDFDVSDKPFLKRVLIDEWETLGNEFQEFIRNANMSSNMWLVARKK